MNHRLLTAALVLLAAAPALAADALDHRLVDAEAKWLLFADARKLRQNPIAEAIRRKHINDERTTRKLDDLKQTLGLKSWDDLQWVLLYGRTFRHGDGALIVKARVDQQAVLNYLKGKPDRKTTQSGRHMVHSWTYEADEKRGKSQKHTVTMAFCTGDLIVMARNADDFKAALKVLDGESANLSNGKAKLVGRVPEGASIFFEAAGPLDPQDDGARRMHPLRAAEHLTFALLHNDDSLTIRVAVAARDAEMAMQLMNVVEGLRSMMMLKHGGEDDAEARKLIKALQFRIVGDNLEATWTMSNEQVEAIIKHHDKNGHGWGRRHHRRHDRNQADH